MVLRSRTIQAYRIYVFQKPFFAILFLFFSFLFFQNAINTFDQIHSSFKIKFHWFLMIKTWFRRCTIHNGPISSAYIQGKFLNHSFGNSLVQQPPTPSLINILPGNLVGQMCGTIYAIPADTGEIFRGTRGPEIRGALKKHITRTYTRRAPALRSYMLIGGFVKIRDVGAIYGRVDEKRCPD